MLNFLDKYPLIKGQSAFGVELVYNSKDNYTLIALELKTNKTGVEINRRFIDLTLEQLVKENVKKIPIYLSIGGKGVIHKKVKINEHSTEQELLNQVLPNALMKDFYLQRSILPNYECWVSIIRKDVLDELIGKIEKLHLFTVEVYLGPFAIDSTMQLLNKAVLLTTTHELLIEKDSIIQMDSLGSVSGGEEYNIEGEVINSHEIIAFGTAFNHFAPSNKLSTISSAKVTQFKEEYLNKNKWVVVGFSMVAVYFLLVMLNLMVASSFEKSHNELQYQVNSKRKFVDELTLLENDLKIKEQFVKGSGVVRASKISYYADQVALSIPKSIQLNQLFVNPLEKKINKAEDINFNYNRINITGTVSRSIDLNNWVKTLKKYEWATEINIISYLQDNMNTAGEFQIEVEFN